MIFYLLAVLLKGKSAEEEIELINKIILKEENALAELYDLYSGLLYSLIMRIVKNQQDAEEILQEIFLTVWKKAELFNFRKGNVYGWLVALTRNKAIDKTRSKSFKNQSVLKDISGINEMNLEIKYNLGLNQDLIFKLDEREQAAFISKALNELPAEQKMVIELAYFEGFSQTEISETLNIPLGTVKTRTRQALNKLQTLLSKAL